MGVSVAYLSSIALLALAASEPRSSNGQGDTTTYFDSVVFLTMFLLSGKLSCHLSHVLRSRLIFICRSIPGSLQ